MTGRDYRAYYTSTDTGSTKLYFSSGAELGDGVSWVLGAMVSAGGIPASYDIYEWSDPDTATDAAMQVSANAALPNPEPWPVPGDFSVSAAEGLSRARRPVQYFHPLLRCLPRAVCRYHLTLATELMVDRGRSFLTDINSYVTAWGDCADHAAIRHAWASYYGPMPPPGHRDVADAPPPATGSIRA